MEANLTIALQLGVERSRLVGSPLGVHIVMTDRDAFRSHLGNVLKDKTHQTCEARFMNGGGGSFHTLLDTILVEDAGGDRQLRISVTDIAERRKAEERVRVTLESITDGFLACDADWRFIYLNAAAERLLGVSRTEVLGKCHWEVYPLCLGTRLESEYRRAAAGEVRDFENFYEPWGRWFHLRCYPHEGGGISVYFEDITERKRTADALRESEERLRLFIEHAPVQLAMFDRGMRYLSFSRAWISGHNLGDRDLTGLSHYDVFPEISEEWKTVHRRALAGEVLRADADSFERADGSVQWLRWEARPWYDAAGDVGGIVIFSEDITERKQMGEALRESEEQFRRLAESSADFIMRYDREGRHLYVNPTCVRISGIPAEKFIGRTHRQLGFGVEESKELKKRIRKVFDTAEPEHWDFEFESAQGWVYLDWRVVPEFSEDGIVKTVLGVSRDITERVQAEHALREANSALKVLLKQREEDRTELEESLLKNVKHLIMPYLEKLKRCRLVDDQRNFVGIMESHLLEITSPFVHKISVRMLGLTPTEIRVADLIRHGKCTKDIADLLGISSGPSFFIGRASAGSSI